MLLGEIAHPVTSRASIPRLLVSAEWSAPDGVVHKKPYLWVWAEVDSKRVGRCAFVERAENGGWEAFGDPGVLVDLAWRRRGVARAMYDFAASLLPGSIFRTRDLTDDGISLWSAMRASGVIECASPRIQEQA
jgi:GNAT superfamily N-acetyltransferase